MAKAAKAMPAVQAAAAPKTDDGPRIVYVPRETGDPAEVTFHGMKFLANVPRRIPAVTLETLRGNAWFEIVGDKEGNAKKRGHIAHRHAVANGIHAERIDEGDNEGEFVDLDEIGGKYEEIDPAEDPSGI